MEFDDCLGGCLQDREFLLRLPTLKLVVTGKSPPANGSVLSGGQRDAGWQREHMSQNRLAILPNLTHYEMFMAPEMATTARSFLDGYKAPPKWVDQVAKQ